MCYRIFASHYDTLKLKRDCTPKEIREAFLDLSKQLHPDKTNNPNNHAQFVKLNEAYSVLSKPHSRSDYDLFLSNPSSGTTGVYRNGYVLNNSTCKGNVQRVKSKETQNLVAYLGLIGFRP